MRRETDQSPSLGSLPVPQAGMLVPEVVLSTESVAGRRLGHLPGGLARPLLLLHASELLLVPTAMKGLPLASGWSTAPSLTFLQETSKGSVEIGGY